MKRRDFITRLGGAAVVWTHVVSAQSTDRVRKIGVLQGLTASDPEWQRRLAAFRQGLQELGWIEGRNVAFEIRSADGKPDRLPGLAIDLVRANVDVIITQGTEPVQAALKATRATPIIMTSIGDAVGVGIVASLARPGGNITGLTLVSREQASKRLEMLKEILPSLARVAVLWNANNASHRLAVHDIEAGAWHLGIQLQSLEVRDSGDVEIGFRAAAQARAEAIVTMDDVVITFDRRRIVDLAMRQRLPVIGEFRPFPEAGALMSYGPSLIDNWQRAASYVDKIFKGARPADLAVEQPTKFELVINLKTAKALGLTVPQSILLRADEVIQ